MALCRCVVVLLCCSSVGLLDGCCVGVLCLCVVVLLRWWCFVALVFSGVGDLSVCWSVVSLFCYCAFLFMCCCCIVVLLLRCCWFVVLWCGWVVALMFCGVGVSVCWCFVVLLCCCAALLLLLGGAGALLRCCCAGAVVVCCHIVLLCCVVGLSCC